MRNASNTEHNGERGEESSVPWQFITQHDADMHEKCQALRDRLHAVEQERDAVIRELAHERLKHAHPTSSSAPTHSTDPTPQEQPHHRRRTRQETLPAGKERRTLELLARKYCVMYAFWLPHETVLQVPALPDPVYDPAHRFASPEMRVRGQIADLAKVLPEEYRGQIHLEPWANTWEAAMQQQRSNCVSRVRECAMTIFECTAADISTSAARLAAFKHDIGFSTHHNGREYYKAMAPILYDGYEGEHDPSKLFLNPKLLKVFAVVVLGPSALNDAGAYHARSHTVYKLWKLRRITAGAIATSAILARFILSADSILESKGHETRIHYEDDFNSYVEYLLTGLTQRDPSVLGIFETWNKAFFPGAHATDRDEDDPMDGCESESGSASESEYDDSAAAALAALRSEPPVRAVEPECRHHLKTEDLSEPMHVNETGKRTREPSLEDSKAEVVAPPRKKLETDEVDHEDGDAGGMKQH